MKAAAHTWEFKARFRKNAFGWKSQPAITRIKEALSEIRKVAKKDPVLAAEGAVLFLERLAPALTRIDSSSGAIGTAVGRAIDQLVPIIARADVDDNVRHAWLERLWQAIQDDKMPYIEALGDRWGELCGNPQLASIWADEFLPITRIVLSPEARPGDFYDGTSPCLSALLAAGRYEELLALTVSSRKRMLLDYRMFGIRALAASGRADEAITQLEAAAGRNGDPCYLARCGEEILLAAGQTERAFQTYGFAANLATTFLATYRALCKKYPAIDARAILDHCIESTPNDEGKWFAAARHAGLLDVAEHLAITYRTEPKTLITAAREHAATDPLFAMNIGFAALQGIDAGYGYDEPTHSDVRSAYDSIMLAAATAGRTAEVTEKLRAFLAQRAGTGFVWPVLKRLLDA